jgi:hypothetical protein
VWSGITHLLPTTGRIFWPFIAGTPLHAGLVIIVPNVKPALQRQLFETALGLISERDLVNTVIEVGYSDEQIECRQYPLSLGS